MASKKRNAAQKKIDLVEMEVLALQGKSQREIAEILSKRRDYTLSRQQIQYDMRKVELIWQEEAKAEIDIAKNRTLAELRNLQAEYWAAWLKSQGEIKTITRKGVAKAPKVSKDSEVENNSPVPLSQEITEHIETQVGDPRYLTGVLNCIEKRCDILGINAPQKIEQSTKNIDYSIFTQGELERIVQGESETVVYADALKRFAASQSKSAD